MQPYTLITGATSGIGLATARALADDNWLILSGRNESKLQEVVRELGLKHLYFVCDLSNTQFIAETLSYFLKSNNALISKLVHCAGQDQTLPAKSIHAEPLHELMRVNFYCVVEIIRTLLKRSVNHSALSNILFISSISAIRGFRGKGAYSASKAALDGYMRALSKELAPKVSVNSILPGAVPTPLSKSSFDSEELVAHFKEIYPLGIGKVEQVVSVIKSYHDASDLWVTGQQIIVDGGMTS